MANILEYIIKFNGTNKVVSSLNNVEKAIFKVTKNFDNIRDVAFKFNQIGDAVQNFGDTLTQITQPGVDFQKSMADLQAITGIAGKQLTDIGENARKTALLFGGEASNSVESYKLLLSQLGPAIATDAKALDAMGRNVAVLSKQMGNDATSAASVLTAAMNQFGVDINNPKQAVSEMSRMMNVMAAAAREGSAELPAIKNAIESVGAVAHNAGLSFETTNAAIQLLDKYGKKGAEGGVALRNVLGELSEGRFATVQVRKELEKYGISVEKLADKTIPFTQRLQMLNPLVNDSALLSKMFGKENLLAAQALISNSTEIENLTGKITGTNTASQQAQIIMGTYAERMSRLKARFADLGIEIFQATEKYLPLIQFSTSAMQISSRLAPVIQGLGNAAIFLSGNIIMLSKNLIIGSLSLLKFAGKMLLTATIMTGQFLLSIVKSTFSTKFWIVKQMQASIALGFLRNRLITTGAATNTNSVSVFKNIFALSFWKAKINGALLSLNAFWVRLKTFSFTGFIKGLAKSGLAAVITAGKWIWAGITGLGTYISSLIAATVAQIGLNVAMSANPIGVVILGLVAIGTAVYMIIKHWDTVKIWLIGLGKFMLKLNPFYWLIKGIDKLFPGFIEKLKEWWNVIVDWFKGILNWFKGIWDNYIAPLLGLDKVNIDVEQNFNVPEKPVNTNENADSDNNNSTSEITNGIAGITGGGTQQKNITINVNKFFDSLNLYSQNLPEGATEIEKTVIDTFLRIVNSANAF